MSKQYYNATIEIEEKLIADSKQDAEETLNNILTESGFGPDIADITLTETADATLDGPKVVLKFSPQKKEFGSIISLDPLGEDTFAVPLEDVLNEDGKLPPSPSHALDKFKTHDRAPLWVQQHSGPYDLRIKHLEDLPDDADPSDYH